MSVQVKRRREAASFLATFVGAQGELIVDTTNYRVQVHDGATPSGWPAACIGDLPARNAVINGTFAINQRGYASGGSLAAGGYAHDRWKAGTSGCTYTFTQTVPDTIVTITTGTLVQAVDAPNVYAAAYWLTWTGTATARVWQGSASGSYAAGTSTKVGGIIVNALLVTGLTVGTIAAIEFSTGTLGLVQFEAALPSAGPTRFERRHLAHEILLCQRYYAKTYQMAVAPGSANFVGAIRAIVNGGGNRSGLYWSLAPRMRATPTIQIYSSSTGAAGKAYDEDSAADVAAYVYSIGEAGISAVDVSGTSSHAIVAHFTASAEL